jgi:polyphosphate:AMP phosphotransferase
VFEVAELGRKVDKKTYSAELPSLREALLNAQFDLLESPTASLVILVNGVDGAGKGETVNLLSSWLDPRHIQSHASREYTDEERTHPPLWRYWRDLPAKGKIGIFFGSWYTMPILEYAQGKISEADFDQAMDELVRFERMLVCERVKLLKLWFHLSKSQQKQRFSDLAADRHTSWRVTKQDWENHRHYDTFRPICERALRRTSVAEASWHVIEGFDPRYRSIAAGRLVVQALHECQESTTANEIRPTEWVSSVRSIGEKTMLESLDLAAPRIAPHEYEKRLEALSGRLARLTRRKAFRQRSVVAVFEGVDAAGKGGAIRRVTAALDARLYRVIPVAAPTDEERSKPYLWRFWRHVPQKGHLAIFDRSWYGRVLVERVEGFCEPAAWQRAYSEINDFEEQLVRHGTIVIKFWLHIDLEEQKLRFDQRSATGFKRFKITEEDWRNRSKWPDYEIATHEMFTRTSTELAPWVLIAANDKHHARLQVLETICERLERTPRW